MNFDFAPYAIDGATRPDSFSRMDPDFRAGLAQMLQAADSELGAGLQVYSGYRSPELQARLYKAALKKYGSEKAARRMVAPPGRSRHNMGLAADLKWKGVRIDKAPKEIRDWIRESAGRFGLDVPMDWEPWQVEKIGARGGGSSAPAPKPDAASNSGGAVAPEYSLGPIEGDLGAAGPSGGDSAVLTTDPAAIEGAYRAYASGRMSPAQRSQYEADVRSGRMVVPSGMSLYTPAQGQSAYDAYLDGRMSDAQRARYESDVSAGLIPLPEGVAPFGAVQDPAPALEPILPTSPTPSQPTLGPTALSPEPVPANDPISPIIPTAAPPEPRRGPAQVEPIFDLARKFSAPGFGLAGRAARSLSGGEQFGSAMIPDSVPLGLGGIDVPIPSALKAAAGPVLDAGMAIGGLASGVYGGLAGAAGDLVDMAGIGRGKALSRDLMSLPDALAGSPSMITAPARMTGRAGARGLDAPDGGAQTSGAGALPLSPEVERRRIGELAYRAGRGDDGAIREISRLAGVDAEAADAAQRLGINLPADILGTNPQLDEIAGMLRVVKGSEASREWEATISSAAQRAQEIIEGGLDQGRIAEVSSRVRSDLESSMEQLGSAGREIYESVGTRLPKGARVRPNASLDVIKELLEDRSDPKLLPPSSRALYDFVTREEGVTYTDLKDLKAGIGRAIQKKEGDYKDADTWLLGKLYESVGQDMLSHVRSTLGDDAGKQIESANSLWRQRAELSARLRDSFGRNMQGDIASIITGAVRGGAKGSEKTLNRLLSVVPEDLRAGAVMAGIDELTRVTSGPNAGRFSFDKFHTTWGGLQRHPGVMAQIRESVGPEQFSLLKSLHDVSRKISKAQYQVTASKRTGASLTSEVFVDSILSRTLDSTAGRVAKSGAAGAVTGVGLSAVGVPPAIAGIASGAAMAGTGALTSSGRRMRIGAAFMNSEAFQAAAVEAARKGYVTSKTRRKILRSGVFRKWANVVGLSSPEAWVATTFAGGQAAQNQEND